jgi:REP element-mobilizing transposase RayT
MSKSTLFTERLYGGNIYHIYNQTNNKEPMFRSVGNRIRFLRNLEKYISPFAHIFVYNLLGNHFHLLIEVLLKEEMMRLHSKQFFQYLSPKCQELVYADEDNMDEILENRFRSMLSGYSTYYNKRNERRGNFFHRPFCRKLIDNNEYFKKAVYYIHTNAIRHGLVEDLLDYDWTSFHSVIVRDKSLLSLDRMYEYFGGEGEFFRFHAVTDYLENDEDFVIEEEQVFKNIGEVLKKE